MGRIVLDKVTKSFGETQETIHDQGIASTVVDFECVGSHRA